LFVILNVLPPILDVELFVVYEAPSGPHFIPPPKPPEEML